MSEILEEFPRHRGRPPIYPWDEWTDGQIRKLYQGRDFDSTLRSFRTLVHRTAKDRNLKAETRFGKGEETVTVRFYQP